MGYGLGFIKRLRLRFSDYAFRVHGYGLAWEG